MAANAATRLSQYYVDKWRRLPWRSPPGAAPPDPYAVWLSEIMLQQTTVAAVGPRFERFIRRWPTVEALAAAPDEDVLGEWAGLGYYARARNLIACARTVVAMGGFPRTEAGLRALPGVGDYTAAAIAAIAFGRRAIVVDTNIERIVARLRGLDGPAAPRRRQVRRALEELTPASGAGDFAQALMDLGATICRPRAPECRRCPLAGDCTALRLGTPEAFGGRDPRPERPQRHGIAWWIEKDGQVWLVRRPASGLLGGMAALPGTDWTAAEPAGGPVLARVRHMFTHLQLDLAICAASEPAGAGWWQDIDRIGDGLPALYRRAAQAVLDARKGAHRATVPLEEAMPRL